MAAKIVIIFSLAVAASAITIIPSHKLTYVEPEAPAQYEYVYSVKDEHSGDIKEQNEARIGNEVHGSYSLVQPDGVHRIVEYTADKEHGFNAIVRYEGHPNAAPAKIAYAAATEEKITYSAPFTKIAYDSPIDKYTYAPIAKVTYAAPVTKFAYAAAPVTNIAYNAPLPKYSYAAAPITKVAYKAPLAQVIYSSPPTSYHH